MAAPPGTRLTTNPTRGRCLLANRPFQPGELIATFTQPLLALPDGPGMRTTCNYCLRVEQPGAERSLRACTGCRAVVYCDANCQRAHWKVVHKVECKMFSRVREKVGKDWLPTPTRAVAQVLLLLKAGDPAMLAAFGDECSLEGNVEGFRGVEEVWADFELQAMAAVVYGGLLESEEMLTKAKEVLCKIQTNAFNRLDADNGAAGIFLDAGLSMINHSCVPNAFIGFDKRTAMLRAERPIVEGEEIQISYIDVTLPRSVRHDRLKLYHFQCACPRCKDDLDVYQVCAASPVVDLNKFSLQPNLQKLRNPTVDRSKVSSSTVETIHKACNSPAVSKGGEAFQQCWKLCRRLGEAGMWAVEPVPSFILEVVTSRGGESNMAAYLLSLTCFLATECDPVELVAPFMAARVKTVMMIARLLSETARQTAMRELATNAPLKDLVDVLEKCDQVSICEGALRLVVHHAAIGASADWEVLQEAREMLQEVEALEGREKETAMLRRWAADPGDPEAAAFFHAAVLQPVNQLAALAPRVMDEIAEEVAGRGKKAIANSNSSGVSSDVVARRLPESPEAANAISNLSVEDFLKKSGEEFFSRFRDGK